VPKNPAEDGQPLFAESTIGDLAVNGDESDRAIVVAQRCNRLIDDVPLAVFPLVCKFPLPASACEDGLPELLLTSSSA